MRKKKQSSNTPMPTISAEEMKTNFEVVYQFRTTLTAETDRGCSLMAASYLEAQLEAVLQKIFVGTIKQKNDLFGFNGPVGTFSSKIKIAFAIGLISEEHFNDLNWIRKIRNEFGHDFKPIGFDTSHISNLVKNLKSHYFEQTEVGERDVFTNTVLSVLAHIYTAKMKHPHFSPRQHITQSAEHKGLVRSTSIQIFNSVSSTISEEEKQQMTSEQYVSTVRKRALEFSNYLIENLMKKKT
jgi:DNA-binding MltR family transcriptional regulator